MDWLLWLWYVHADRVQRVLRKNYNHEQLTEPEYKFIENYIKDFQEKIKNGGLDPESMSEKEQEELSDRIVTFAGALIIKDANEHPEEYDFDD